MTEAYPLSWPVGWPRTPASKRRYNYQLKTATFDAARRSLYEQFRMLKATNVVLSTNIPLRNDGNPYASMKPVDNDPGIAVYFTLRGKNMSMARDEFDNVAQNLRSLGMAVEHLRGLERHGGASMLERAFAGFQQLPPPGGAEPDIAVDWRDELGPLPEGLEQAEMLAVMEARYRTKAKKAHPDIGGSPEAMMRLNMAIKQAREELS